MCLPELGSLLASSGGWTVKCGAKWRDKVKVEKALNSHLLTAVGFGPFHQIRCQLSALVCTVCVSNRSVQCLAFSAMVNDTVDIAAHILDFNLDASTSLPQSQNQTLPHSSSSNTLKLATTKKQQQKVRDQLAKQEQQQVQQNAGNSHILPNSAENLSWTFFEHVSTLDKQLRGDEELSSTDTNGCHLMSTSPMQAYAIQENVDARLLLNNAGPTQETILRKQNGYAPLSTAITTTVNHCAKVCDPIHSQQTTDLIQQQHQQQNGTAATELQLESATTFQFTSPTATFKRKKQQQQLQKQQQQQFEHHQYHNNNNNNCVSNQTVTATVINNSLAIEESQSKSKSPSRASVESGSNVQQHATTTATTSIILNGIGVAAITKATKAITVDDILTIGGGGAAGYIGSSAKTTATTTNIRTPRTNRTLPRIATTTTTPRAAYAADKLDLVVGNHSHNKRQRATAKVKQAAQQQQRQLALQQHALPKSMTAGAAGGGSSSATGSGNSSNHSNSNNNNNNNSNTLHKANSILMDSLGAHLELVGWRKKCLYGLLVLLMLLIITNLVLTLWILKVMEFTTDGMGQLKIVPGGIQLTGQALIMDMLRASTIRSRHGQPIAIESSRNFSINTRDANGMLENHLFLGHDKLECLAKEIRINDTNGRNLFSVNQNEVTIGAHALRIDGEGGAIFRESIQTPHVRAEPGRELRLESPTRQLELTAAKDINLQSRAGAIEVAALKDVRLSALDGSVSAAPGICENPYAKSAYGAATATRSATESRPFASCLPAVRLLERQTIPGRAAFDMRRR
ncbi:myb-like protein P isoform X2 [Zeugodacus cucurbitae]|uniref:myb-like protein P isoform X2 n=1 Tax=Zeugodacus cucurbitae TaxID=28588 RepID=UPI0023D93C83|nr:myb-like protein P isoform X2 [Zeugodacus cucurbitae]